MDTITQERTIHCGWLWIEPQTGAFYSNNELGSVEITGLNKGVGLRFFVAFSSLANAYRVKQNVNIVPTAVSGPNTTNKTGIGRNHFDEMTPLMDMV